MVQLSPLRFNSHNISKICLQDLLDILNGVPGTRHILILEKSISKRLNLLTPFNVLKEKGNIVSALWLEDEIGANVNLNNLHLNSFVIVCNNDIQNTELIAKKVKELILINPNFKITGIIIDEITRSFEFRLEQLGVKGELELYPWDLKPSVLDDDLLSLELFEREKYNALKDLYLKNLNEPLFKLSKSLLNLVNLFPTLIKFNNVLLKGNKSVAFYENFKNLKNEYLSSLNPVQRKQEEMFEKASYLNASLSQKAGDSGDLGADQFIDLIVLERGLDFLTPLLNQLTYLGLVDELYNLESNTVTLPHGVVLNEVDTESEEDNNKKQKTVINKINFNYKEDEILQRIKYLNFAAVGPILNTYAKSLQTEFEARHKVKKISEVKEFVGKLSTLQKNQFHLKNHTLLAESILNQVKGATNVNNEDENSQDTPVLNVDNEEESERLFSQSLELQQGILDNYYDYKKATEILVNLIYDGLGCNDTLRLCCLLSKVKNGINEKNYHLLKNEIISNFGIKHLITLQNLKIMRLFYVKESYGPGAYLLSSTTTNSDPETINNDGEREALKNVSYLKDFSGARNYLNLTPTFAEEELASRADDPENPIDAAFAFPNYVPITTRLVQAAYDRSFFNTSLSTYLSKSSSRYLSKYGSWKGIDDLWRFLLGNTKETNFFETLSSNARPLPLTAPTAGSLLATSKQPSLTFVVMIGGITYGEIATLRYIEKQLESKGVHKRFVILTDGIVNGNLLIEAAIPQDINDC